MNEDTAQLTESLVAHEHLVPDAADVLARANAIARSYQRRRWAVRATGSAVVGAGLVAGGIALPGWVGQSSNNRETIVPSSGDGQAATPADSSPAWTPDEELTEFVASGYTYEDAQQLATLWKDNRVLTKVKADAGLKLLQGETLPIQPSGTPETPAERGQEAFFAAGYDYDDAVTLGNMWHETDVTQVKSEAGQKLLDGQPLPISPSGTDASDPLAASGAKGAPTPTSIKLLRARALALAKGETPTAGGGVTTDPQTEADYQAYFAAGYDYDDAVALGKIWNETDIGQIKAEAGQQLLAGDTLPVQPSGQPESQDTKAIDAFFNAGYTYDDAVTLANMWHETDIGHVKVAAGQKLLDGQTLPIAP